LYSTAVFLKKTIFNSFRAHCILDLVTLQEKLFSRIQFKLMFFSPSDTS